MCEINETLLKVFGELILSSKLPPSRRSRHAFEMTFSVIIPVFVLSLVSHV